jgi:hypothetical protein
MRVPRPSDSVKPPRQRKDLNADALFAAVRTSFEAVCDPRQGSVRIPLADAAMAAFAMFSLKDPSLLAFEQRRLQCDPNLQSIYGVGEVPCDSQMRSILDPLDPDQFRPAFRAIFKQAQRGKVLEPFVFLEGCYLVSVDGTEYYRSDKLGSPACMTRVHKKTGKTTYYQQMLGAVIVHPDQRAVIPLSPETIRNTDGKKKNDCERNAIRRWLGGFRQDHPKLPVIITEDALSPNAPHIRDLWDHDCHFILGVKPGDHTFLFDYVESAHAHGLVTEYEMVDPDDPQITHRFRFLEQVPLNKSNLDVLVTFVEHWEVGPKDTKHFAWVTDLNVTTDNLYSIMRGGRARWRVENETFNTLKNQGYHLEHNFGLGKQNLSAVFVSLMMLAFLVDQLQQHCCKLFQAAWAKLRTKRALWEEMRAFFRCLLFDSMADLYRAILHGIERKPPKLLPGSS